MAGSAKGIRAGRAYVELSTDTTALARGLRAAEARLKTFGKAVGAIGAGLSGLGASAVVPLFGAAKSFADAGSELADASARTGASVEALSALGFAAKQTGTDLGTLELGFRQMQRALVKGSEENLQAEATFEALGLSIGALMRMTPDEQFASIAKAIDSIPHPTARAAAAMQVFGKSGTALLPLISDMDALTTQAKELGYVMSTDDANAADALGDSMDAVTATMHRLDQVLGAAIAPLLTELADAMARNIAVASGWIAQNRSLIATAFKIGAAIAAIGATVTAAGVAIYGLGAVLGGLATGLNAIVVALGAVLSPIGLLVAGLAGLTVWFVRSTRIGGQALDWLGKRFGDLAHIARDTFRAIASAIKAGDIGLAARVLWAGLKVESLKALGRLKAIWADWGTASIEVFRGVTYALARLWINATARVETILAKSIGKLANIWGDLTIWMIRKLVPLEGALGTIFGVDIGKTLQDAVAQAASETNAAANDKATAGQVAAIESRRKDAQVALKSQQDTETEARRKAAVAGAQADAAALADAQAELDKLLAQAGKPIAGMDIPKDKTPGFTPEDLDAAVEQTRAKVDVAGSFSASALAGLGAGSTVGEKQLSEQQKTNDKLDKLNRVVKNKQAAFT